MWFSRFPETIILAAVAIIAAVVVTVFPARADCLEELGCTDKDYFVRQQVEAIACEELWHLRNRIYDDNGYCFKSRRGQDAFSNDGCQYDADADVPLNEVEQANVTLIAEVETANGCKY